MSLRRFPTLSPNSTNKRHNTKQRPLTSDSKGIRILEKLTEPRLNPTPETSTRLDRRDMLKKTAAAAGMLVALPMLTRAARADDPAPTAPPPADNWKPAGDPADFKVNEPKRADLGVVVVWITRLDSRNLEAVSAHCTHRGCELGWDDTSSHLVCPCHGSVFNADGSNVSGTRNHPDNPLPHLKVLPVRVKDGQVEVNVAVVQS